MARPYENPWPAWPVQQPTITPAGTAGIPWNYRGDLTADQLALMLASQQPSPYQGRQNPWDVGPAPVQWPSAQMSLADPTGAASAGSQLAGGGGGAYPTTPGGGSPGGGGGGTPAMAAWEGAIPETPFIPWTNWAQTPWAQTPTGRAAEAMQWFNTVLPWMQAQQQGQQWGQEFAQRQASDLWSQGFQEEQFDWQQVIDEWSRQLQQQQLQQQAQEAAMGAFGRRWAPNTRWM